VKTGVPAGWQDMAGDAIAQKWEKFFLLGFYN
jgi:hypothetical protein